MDAMGTLTRDEKATITKIIGNLASPLAWGVAQLFTASPSSNSWEFSNCWGAVVFVIDRDAQTKFIRIFDLESFECTFEQEIYDDFDYYMASEWFHCFEAEGFVAGLNFSDPSEARSFGSKVRSMASSSNPNLHTTKAPKKRSVLTRIKTFFRQDQDDQNGAQEITGPTNFVHRQHIGFHPDTGFEIRDIPPEWKAFFKNVGIKKRELQNPETAKIILDAVQTNIGASYSEEPPEAKALPPLPPVVSPKGALPPPPPPRPAGAPPLPPTPVPAAASLESPSAPLPPPPLPPAGAAAPPPPPLPPALPTLDSAGSVPAPPPPVQRPAAPPAPPAKADSRNDLLAQIREGRQLKKVEEPTSRGGTVSLPQLSKLTAQQTNSLASTIASAIIARRQHVVEEVPQEEDETDDWSD